ncbi:MULTISPECIES: YraN family protein [unclassified Brevundimonas]|uniref:YraN family protein n=1 Tax=unclassified Brevundimonas TaxID=2622653 RepID=UPI0025C24201|nr:MULTISPECIES: YraN family protein [unclassified Brevundimonas]
MRGKDKRHHTGRRAYRAGHRNEWLAAFYLMAKGYQILGFRLKTPIAEIDVLARRGRHLVVIEVKSRQDINLAQLSLSPDQRDRLLRAGYHLCRSRPALGRLTPRLDLIALSPRRFPRHVRGLTTDGRQLI